MSIASNRSSCCYVKSMDIENAENRLVLHGSEDHKLLRKRLWDAVKHENIQEIELVDMHWTTLDESGNNTADEGQHHPQRDNSPTSPNDLHRVFERRLFDKVILRGEQRPISLDFPVRAISLQQVHFDPTSRIQFGVQYLKELSCVSMSLDQDLIASLSQIFAHNDTVLEKLDLSDSRILNDGPQELELALQQNQSMKWMSLSECNLQDEPLTCILRGLRVHPSMEHLDISFNKCALDGEAIPQLGLILESTQTLNSLNMGFCAFGSGRQVNLSHIFRCLSNPSEAPESLKVLQLGGNNLHDDSMNDIVTMLMRNNHLEHLDLSSNRFTDQAILLLAENLAGMKAVRVLELEENEFSKEGVRHLRNNIESNGFIEAIEIDEELSNTPEGRRLNLHLDLNWGRQRILSEEKSVPLSLWPLILARANNFDENNAGFERVPSSADIILHFLKKSPMFQA